ncbi:rhodanese-like domain-containing protein 6 isoform X1 [Syzygium oleosum]|uniref:rhodanese-like domain-containing protein 6 isoform X1 n=1 Tax=Syzygium oleosum TaxID=219896 RepID=UPI0011D19DF0|nr:rhodanese-like domain-containing protein 6 isoform X1 [Syzygium oleosum]
MSDLARTEPYGVLLYYKYASVPDLDELASFYERNCSSLGLLGRVRLAPHGVNVTVGGKLLALEAHIDAVQSNALFEGTDFKLASCDQPLNDKVAKECGFTSLSIRIVEELVTFSSHPLIRSPDISIAGRHLSAVEFHSVLQSAGKLLDEGSPTSNERPVLLDARNLYETRIGKFQTPGVETLDPEIRQYSDLHDWIDNNSERLRGKHILMYCTGGIRCEMASAYIKGKGSGFENVYQLYGGIQRYLEQFPNGGFFRGKNFVFDHRISVGSSNTNVLSTCLLCSCPFDDYSSRCRCASCRMLVLVCDSCRQVEGSIYMCELCQIHGKCGISAPATENCKSEVLPEEIKLKIPLSSGRQAKTTGAIASRKLRILCLHGFRQNASSFKGRTASLAKKLRNIAELVFVDAPHELCFIYQPSVVDGHSKVSTEHRGPPKEKCNKKFAWLVPPDFSAGSEADWKEADGPFDPLQYQQQTGGFDSSLAYLKSTYLRDGPFDGILGFSQGAAMAALVCARKDKLKGEMDFRFAILCSGFALNLAEFEHGSINCPSLHIFGSDRGRDRQIPNTASAGLAEYFEDGSRVIIEHDNGHIIPTRPPYIDEIKDFLQRFL